MASLRTPEGEETYNQYRAKIGDTVGCGLCNKEALKTFTYWKIIENQFPYDRIASTHHMVIPLRHVTEKELNDAERQEMIVIKEKYMNTEYEFIIEATPKKKSVPGHFHLHLIVAKQY